MDFLKLTNMNGVGTRTVRASLTLALLSGLLGCAGLPVEQASNRLKTVAGCCKSFGEMTFRPVSAGTREKLEFTVASAIFASEHGNAFFGALQLPPAVPKRLEIEAYFDGPLFSATYVDPVFVFLDAQKRELKTIAQPSLMRSYRSTIPGFFTWFFGATIEVPSTSSYLIVYAHPASSRQQTAYSDNGTPWPINAAPIGEIGLKFVN